MTRITDQIPDTATIGEAGHTTDHNTLHAILASLGSQSLGDTTIINVDEQIGGNDDAKVAAALSLRSTIISNTNVAPILYFCGGKQWSLTTPISITTNAFKMMGAPGLADEKRGSLSCGGTFIGLNSGTTPFFTIAAETFGHSFENINFEAMGGNNSQQFMANTLSSVMWTTRISNCSWTEFKHVLGKPGSPFYLNACTLAGWLYVNNAKGPSFNIGGSDNIIFDEGMLIDSPNSYLGYWTAPSSNNGEGFHITFNYLEKSTVGPIYMTTREQISGVLILGGNSTDGQLVCTGWRVEGQNRTTGTNGCLVRQTGGGTTFRDCWFGYAMKAPSSGPLGNSVYNKGIIECFGGKMLLDGSWYARCTSPAVAETVPFVYNNGGEVYVDKTMRSNSDGAASWTGRPRVMAASGTTVVDNFSTSLGLPTGYVQTATVVNSSGSTI